MISGKDPKFREPFDASHGNPEPSQRNLEGAETIMDPSRTDDGIVRRTNLKEAAKAEVLGNHPVEGSIPSLGAKEIKMPRVRNAEGSVETPLPQLQKSLSELQPGQKVSIAHTKEEILKIRENITKRRHEIVGADDHLDYIEALLLAEAGGQLQFKS